MSAAPWFEVDKEGLAKLLERRGKEFVLYELVQNALDERTSLIDVRIDREAPGSRSVRIYVEDDSPAGFADLAHAWTLFAESAKKQDVEKRGRFNLGEKLVLALCESAEIRSTTGGVRFDYTGRHAIRHKRASGSQFVGILRMTTEEQEECERAIDRIIVPPGVVLRYNGRSVLAREVLRETTASLATESAGVDGILRRAVRHSLVQFFEPQAGEVGTLYELGIPVVETGDRWHVNVCQKVPLNSDRDNVTPAYLAHIRSVMLIAMAEELTSDDASSTWVKNAVQERGEDIPAEVIERCLSLRFGDKRVSFDMSDGEANNLAVAAGYAVVHGGALSSREWEIAKQAGAILPAGQVTPSPKPFTADGEPLRYLPESKWTLGMCNVAALAQKLAPHLGIRSLSVSITNEATWRFAATYSGKGASGSLILNVGSLGHKWFSGELAPIIELLVHEFAHSRESNHLSSGYHDALSEMAGTLVALALDKPELFKVGAA